MIAAGLAERLGALCLMVALPAMGCGPATPSPKQSGSTTSADMKRAGPKTGRIVFECTPLDAQIVVDGASRGTAEQVSQAGGLNLPLGLHRFEITREGFRAFRIELNLSERPERVRVQLKPVAASP